MLARRPLRRLPWGVCGSFASSAFRRFASVFFNDVGIWRQQPQVEGMRSRKKQFSYKKKILTILTANLLGPRVLGTERLLE